MNPRQAKTKGRETEQMLVDHLRRNWALVNVERRRLTGRDDQGDIAGWLGVCVEVKSGARIDIAGWLDELAAEIRNAHAEVGFVAVRPRGKPDPADWYALLPLDALLELLREVGWIPRGPQPLPGDAA